MNISSLLEIQKNDRDISWLKDALQTALKLEFSTLPPYLTALWSIDDRDSAAYKSIRDQIAEEEMLHMGLVCNLIVSIGGKPDLTSQNGVPSYPNPLPGMVQPNLEVSLSRYSHETLKTFLTIEYPENPPIKIGNDPKPDSQVDEYASTCAKTIGQFYTEIFEEFKELKRRDELPEFDTNQQLAEEIDFDNGVDRNMFKINSIEDVKRAISIIKRQGEGTGVSPVDTGVDDLSHYYRYLELDRERRIRVINGQFVYSEEQEDQILSPKVHPMATIPKNGYLKKNVSDAVWENIKKFDETYSLMLLLIERAWTHTQEQGGGLPSLGGSVGVMTKLGPIAVKLMKATIPDGSNRTYGPCFRFDSTVTIPDQ